LAKFDLEDRTLKFSKEVLLIAKSKKPSYLTKNILDQLLRSSTSIGANYREANDALGKKDFKLRIKIARKEAKETIYWLESLNETEIYNSDKLKALIRECVELRNILSSRLNKS